MMSTKDNTSYIVNNTTTLTPNSNPLSLSLYISHAPFLSRWQHSPPSGMKSPDASGSNASKFCRQCRVTIHVVTLWPPPPPPLFRPHHGDGMCGCSPQWYGGGCSLRGGKPHRRGLVPPGPPDGTRSVSFCSCAPLWRPTLSSAGHCRFRWLKADPTRCRWRGAARFEDSPWMGLAGPF